MAKVVEKTGNKPLSKTNVTIKKVEFKKPKKDTFQMIDYVLITLIIILTIAVLIVKFD